MVIWNARAGSTEASRNVDISSSLGTKSLPANPGSLVLRTSAIFEVCGAAPASRRASVFTGLAVADEPLADALGTGPQGSRRMLS